MKKCANNKEASESYWNVYIMKYLLTFFFGRFDIPPFQIVSALTVHMTIIAAQLVKIKAIKSLLLT